MFAVNLNNARSNSNNNIGARPALPLCPQSARWLRLSWIQAEKGHNSMLQMVAKYEPTELLVSCAECGNVKAGILRG